MTPQPHRRRPTPGASGSAVLAASVVLGLAACTQPSAPTPRGPTATVEVPIQPTITPIDTALPTMNPSEAAAAGGFDRSADLVEQDCSPANGGWAFHGTLKNPDSVPRTYTVAVFVVKGVDSTTHTQEVDVTVAAGATAPVDIAKVDGVPANASTTDYTCMVGVTIKDQ